MDWFPDISDGWSAAIGLVFGGGAAGAVLIKMADKIIDRLLQRTTDREIRKENEAIKIREELRQDNDRLMIRVRAYDTSVEEWKQKYIAEFQHLVALETENKLLRAAQARMRAYVIYQQEEIRKALNLPASPIMGVPAWLDDHIPGPTAPDTTTPMSPPRDPGIGAMNDSETVLPRS